MIVLFRRHCCQEEVSIQVTLLHVQSLIILAFQEAHRLTLRLFPYLPRYNR